MPQHDPLFGFIGPPRRAWREEAVARASEIRALSNWIDGLPQCKRGEPDAAADKSLAEAIDGHVEEVYSAARARRPWRRTAARLARATSNLHAAEVDLLRRAPRFYLQGELPNLEAHVRRHLPVDDPRRLRLEDLARQADVEELRDQDRESILGTVRAANSAAAREQQRVRSFRAIVVAATCVLFGIAGGVAMLGIFRPALVPLCFEPQQSAVLVCPTGQSPLPLADRNAGDEVDVDMVVRRTVSPWDVPLVEIIGMVAAGVTGAAALRRLRGSSTPFAVPVALNVLKLPTGALTAVLGLLLMRGGFVPGLTALDTTPQIIAWAIVFGASQQLLTGMVDRQAQHVLDSVGGKTYTPSGGS